MALFTDTVSRLAYATTSIDVANEVASAVNNGAAAAAQAPYAVVGAVVATHTSTTTDFGVLKVNDVVLCLPATAGNSIFYQVATAGTLPAAAVIGKLYVVLRAVTLPAATAFKF